MGTEHIKIVPPYSIDKHWDLADPLANAGSMQELTNYIPDQDIIRTRKGIEVFAHTAQSVVIPVNDFSTDANCISWYKLDTYAGNTAVDEISANNMTGSSVSNSAYITQDFTNTIAPGLTASLSLNNLPVANSALLTVPYANQVVKFPGNAGVATTMSVVGWFMQSGTLSIQAQGGIGMWDSASAARSWLIYAFSTNNTWRLIMREVGGSNGLDITTSITLAAGAWYHVKMTFSSASLTGTLRVCNSSGVSLFSGSDTSPGDMKTQNNSMTVGAFNLDPTRAWNGNVQEICIFNDVVTNAEQDQMIAGTYG